jgi:DNA-binding IclR family transcriptional regulator
MATEDAPDTIHSVETLFAIVDVLYDEGEVRLTEIADRVGVSKSTVHRHLATLAAHHYVTKEENMYRLSYRFLDIGAHLRNRDALHKQIRGTLKNIADETGEFVGFVVEEHGLATFLYTEMGSEGVQHDNRVGSTVPLHQIAAGKVILAHLPEERRDEIIDEHGLPASTQHTITDRSELEAELEAVQRHGFAIAREEYTEGLVAVSVPIRYPDESLAGAVLIAGPTYRMGEERLETELPHMLKGAIAEFELNLSYS